MPIHFQNRQRRFPVNRALLCTQAETCLDALGLACTEAGVVLVGDRAMRRLNREHRQVDATTDVLSFPQFAGDAEAVRREAQREARAVPGEPPPLGDVVISVELAHRRAPEHGVTADQEVALLLVHGLLHLAGHDHEQGEAEARAMAAAEHALLTRLGVWSPGLMARAGQER